MLFKSYHLVSLFLLLILVLTPFAPPLAVAEDSGGLYYTVLDDSTVSVSGYYGEITELDIPATYGNRTVSQIDQYVFTNNKTLTTVTIPEGVQTIGDLAFCNCTSLRTVSLPSTLVSIGNDAFGYCPNLSTIKTQNSGKFAVTKGVLFNVYTKTLVKYPSKLKGTSYKIPAGTIVIGNGAFEYTKLSSITIPSSVTTIESFAFAQALIKKINIPAGLSDIEPGAFFSDKKLTSITVDAENSVYIAEDGVLYEKNQRTLHTYPSGKKGKSFSIPEGVVNIGSYAFNQSQLSSIQFTSSVTTLQQYAMSGTNITSVQISASINTIGEGCFFACNSLSEVTFEGCPETIGRMAFGWCNVLKSIQLPEGMTSLGTELFTGCYCLSEVILPESLRTIDDYAFNCCKNLNSIKIPAKVTTINATAFNGIDGLTIKGTSGTYAEKFAKQNGYTFQAE